MDAHRSSDDIIDRLRQHRILGQLPEAELAWVAARGRLRRFEAGALLLRKGQHWESEDIGLEILLKGRIANYVERSSGAQKAMEWQAGDVTGVLPFSRMGVARGNTRAETAVETLSLSPDHFPELIRECPEVTAACVHVMVDRARVFRTSDLQDEKMVSLGKLSAGLAHELNNPASAVARSSRILQRSMAEADRAARALAAEGLTRAQLEAVDRLRDACMAAPPAGSLSPLERADREDRIAGWLEERGGDDSAVEVLAETAVTLEALDELADHLEGPALDAALDWVAAGCAVRMLALENERAGSRISELVGAMKRLTYMDQLRVSEPVDVEQGIRDTVLVLGHKAREKSVGVSIDVAPELPPVYAIGGDLEQVWMNLLDNALDAVDLGGSVSVTVKPEGRDLVVRVIDDGPGIDPEDRDRLFDPFFTTKGPGEGTGLGLDIALAHVRRHRGDITFDSRPGRTEFRVTLPLVEPDDGEPPPSPTGSVPESGAGPSAEPPEVS